MFDPAKHHRRSIRLKDRNYAAEGWYFVTICTHERRCTLGSVVDGEVVLTEFGRLVEAAWLDLPNRFPMVELGAHVAMPNHLHGVIMIVYQCNPRAAGLPRPTDNLHEPTPNPCGTEHWSIPSIIQSYKSEVTKAVRKAHGDSRTPFWQRGYYEHIARTNKALAAINTYIYQNPVNWHQDSDNPETTNHR